MADIGELVARLSMDASAVHGGIEQAEHAFTHLGNHVASIAAGLAGGIGIESLIENVKGQIESATHLGHTAEKFDIPVNSLIALQHQARLAHVDVEALDSGLGKMQKNLFETATGEGKAGEALRMLNISIEDIIGLSPDRQFTMIAEGISHLEDPTARAEAAIKLFGKGGMELMNILREGRAGFEESREEIDRTGQSISELSQKRLEEADKALIRFGESSQTTWRHIAEDMTPVLEGLDTIIRFNPQAAVDKALGRGKEHPASEFHTYRELTDIKEKADTEAGRHKSVALALAEKERAEKLSTEQDKVAKGITESMLTPLQKLNKEYATGLDLFERGKLSGDTLHRIQDKIAEQKENEAKRANEAFKELQDSADRVADSLKTPLQRARPV